MFLDLLEKERGDFLDIGANIGVMSYHASKRFPNSSIFSFEPIPLNIYVLEKIVSKYQLDNVEVHPIALAERNGNIQMVLPKEHKVTMHGLAHVVHESIDTFNEGLKFKVTCQTLDYWMVENQIKSIRGIKLDVENYEHFVLQGAAHTIDNHKPIVFLELWDNQNRHDCMNFMATKNYTCFTNHGNRLEQFDPKTHSTQNFIFIPNDKLHLVS